MVPAHDAKLYIDSTKILYNKSLFDSKFLNAVDRQAAADAHGQTYFGAYIFSWQNGENIMAAVLFAVIAFNDTDIYLLNTLQGRLKESSYLHIQEYGTCICHAERWR